MYNGTELALTNRMLLYDTQETNGTSSKAFSSFLAKTKTWRLYTTPQNNSY